MAIANRHRKRGKAGASTRHLRKGAAMADARA